MLPHENNLLEYKKG